mmetsp:Transcript_57750/g.172368  ORF Transcript_57750/g.172368 Transcript_57750/m.172368 type:complete len:82 (+) Transcript_57750:2109-2354(+)
MVLTLCPWQIISLQWRVAEICCLFGVFEKYVRRGCAKCNTTIVLPSEIMKILGNCLYKQNATQQGMMARPLYHIFVWQKII